MDRTNEFQHIVESSTIPQSRPKEELDNFLTELSILERKIDELSSVYEPFKVVKKLDIVESRLLDLYDFSDKYVNTCEERFYKEMGKIKNHRLSKVRLRIKDIRKKTRANEAALISEETVQQPEVPIHEGQQIHYKENIKKRERTQQYLKINESISEISQIVDDISLHLDLQSEKVERIEEMRENTMSFIGMSYHEIDKKWRRIRGRRKIILRFGILWICIIVLFILLKYFKK